MLNVHVCACVRKGGGMDELSHQLTKKCTISQFDQLQVISVKLYWISYCICQNSLSKCVMHGMSLFQLYAIIAFTLFYPGGNWGSGSDYSWKVGGWQKPHCATSDGGSDTWRVVLLSWSLSHNFSNPFLQVDKSLFWKPGKQFEASWWRQAMFGAENSDARTINALLPSLILLQIKLTEL